MRREKTWVKLLLVTCLCMPCAAGCGEDSTPTIAASAFVADSLTGQPIEGVLVCRYDQPDSGCGLSDGEGRYSATLPANGQFWITYDHDDYYPLMTAVATGTEDIFSDGNLLMSTYAVIDFLAGEYGITVEPDQGHLAFNANASIDGVGRAGVSIAISPEPGGMVGYLDDQGRIDLDATETSTSGVAGWLNIAPGDYVITLSHPTAVCVPRWAFDAGEANTFELKVLPNRTTEIWVVCE